MTKWTEDDLRRHLQKRQKSVATIPYKDESKYRNEQTLVVFRSVEIVGGHPRLQHEFASKKEAVCYQELKIRQAAGEITDLRLQEPFPLMCPTKQGGTAIVAEYLADFVFFDTRGDRHVIDVKGVRTATYRRDKKWLKLQDNVDIEER
jgi:hypothetical protein